MKKASIQDVALLSGVSKTTVSYYLNKVKPLKESTSKKIEEAIRETGYVPQGSARDLRRNKLNIIFILMSHLDGPFYSKFLRGVEDAALDERYDLLLSPSFSDKRRSLRFLEERRADGYLIFDDSIPEEVLKRVSKHCSLMLVNREISSPRISSLIVNNVTGVQEALLHLIAQGCRSIYFIGGVQNSWDNQERQKGFSITVKRHGIRSKIFYADFSGEKARRLAGELIDASDLPDAFFCANDEMAFGFLHAFQERGIKVPDRVKVIGFDDVFDQRYSHLKLTTISQPAYKMGYSATSGLIKNIREGNSLSRHIYFETRFIERGTT